MSIELSAEQERARTAILSWYRNPHRKPWFYLCGFAGVGKTTVITAVTESIRGEVLYAAPTGQAAKVMASKGCRGAQTIHSLIYKPKGTGGDRAAIEKLQAEIVKLDPASPMAVKLNKDLKGLLQGVKPLFSLNPDSRLKNAKLLVVDEVSMCGADIIEDLLSFGVPLLLQGDSAQLPPVATKSFLNNEDCDFELSQIHRQAADSPIIRIATMARQGKSIDLGDYGQGCKVVLEVSPEEALAHDQILVGLNETRHATNKKMRALQGFNEQWPMPGERVICKRNNNQLGLLNGDHFMVTSFDLSGSGKAIIGVCNDNIDTRVVCHTEPFTFIEEKKGNRTVITTKKVDPWNVKSAEMFEYASAITCHSAQGSQWDSVFVLDQSSSFGKDRHRWLYTAASRAAKQLTLKLK